MLTLVNIRDQDVSVLGQYSFTVGKKVDVDDLIDAREVAEMLGLSSPRAVAVYASRGLPEPIIDRGPNTAKLWLRQDIERWLKGRPSSRSSQG
jgi:predicted DNA-binding transcriptional regulator AlpA